VDCLIVPNLKNTLRKNHIKKVFLSEAEVKLLRAQRKRADDEKVHIKLLLPQHFLCVFIFDVESKPEKKV
jgi:hypothetical protein